MSHRNGIGRRSMLKLSLGSLAGMLGSSLLARDPTIPRESATEEVEGRFYPSVGQAKNEALIFASATELARAIGDREVSSREVVDACLDRIEAVNPQLNAVVHTIADQARTRAAEADRALARGEPAGPLHGVPVTIKDNLDVAGVVSTGGTLGRVGFVPGHDATVVARLRAAGAIIIGRTNTPELTLALETDNLVYGRTNNPYDPSRTCGGSSGGAAAIIAAGGSPLDIGSDTAGSIRQPAHFCGIAGLRPTSGRVPRTGHILPPGGVLDSLTQLGPMARRVEDLELVLPVIAGTDWRDPAVVPMPLRDPRRVDLGELRVAFHTDNGIVRASRATAAAVTAAAEALSAAGVTIEEARPTGIERSFELLTGLFGADGAAAVRMLLQMYGTTEPHALTQQLIEMSSANPVSAAQLAKLLFERDRFRSEMLAFMQRYDAILSPVSARPASLHGTTFDADEFPGFSYTMSYSLTGWPAAVLRAGAVAAALPIGVQVVARPWREDVTLALCRAIEQRLGGWRPPPRLLRGDGGRAQDPI